MISRVLLPRILRIGAGARFELCDVLRQSPTSISRVLIVTDKYLESNGWVEELTTSLNQSNIKVEVFSDTVPDPTSTVVEKGIELRCKVQADCVVGLGGGSPIDTAKAIAVPSMIPVKWKDSSISQLSPLPLIALPTTAGTGSECTRVSVIIDELEQDQPKRPCLSDLLLPQVALVDYEYTLSTPQKLSIDTGLDAMVHAVEAAVSRKGSSLSLMYALEALRLMGKDDTLRKVCQDPSKNSICHKSKERMMRAACLAGIAFSNSSTALVHGMSRPLGARFHMTHGASNAMLFSRITQFGLEHASEMYAACAQAFGLRATPEALVEEIDRLVTEFQVDTPKSFGISKEDYETMIPIMVQQAMESGSPATNPRIPTDQEMAQLFKDCYDSNTVSN